MHPMSAKPVASHKRDATVHVATEVYVPTR